MWKWNTEDGPEDVDHFEGESALYWFFRWDGDWQNGRSELQKEIPEYCRTGVVDREEDCFDMDQVLQCAYTREWGRLSLVFHFY